MVYFGRWISIFNSCEVYLKGFVHLDVKPDNFAYSRKGKLLLLDFGCCLRPPVYVPELVGTFAFAARALHGASQEAPVQVNSDLDFESLKFVTRFCFCFFYVVGFVVWVFCFFLYFLGWSSWLLLRRPCSSWLALYLGWGWRRWRRWCTSEMAILSRFEWVTTWDYPEHAHR